MNPRLSVIVPVALVIVLAAASTCPVNGAVNNTLNILEQLKGYEDVYGLFIDVINQTKLYQKINQRNTVTILALTNATMGAIQGRSMEEKENIISTHVLLDYFDKFKLNKITKSVSVTTLYQSSGTANDEQGFVNITRRAASGDILFGSAVKNSSLVARLEKEVMTKPYSLSLLQVSMPIVAPGVGDVILPPPPPPASPPPPAEAPENSSDGDDEESSDAPAEAPAESQSPAPAPSPVGDEDAPASSPAADNASADGETHTSGASRVFVGGLVALMALVINLL